MILEVKEDWLMSVQGNRKALKSLQPAKKIRVHGVIADSAWLSTALC